MAELYLISGLGADYRLYKNLELPGHQINYVNWLEPDNKDTLETYAEKLIRHYDIGQGAVVIGDSLGGMLTIEIAKKILLDKAIVISSIKNSNERPLYFKTFRYLPIYRVIPAKWMTGVGFMIKFVFGKMAAEDEALFKSMLKNSSPKFIKWGMGAVLKWRSTAVVPNVYHITGDKDKVFNFRRIKGATIVKNGTHIMIFDRAKEISAWLMEVLQK